MKKFIIVMILIMFIIPNNVNAQRGCCSHHGGVVGCSANGKQMCADGTLSPTCTCTPSTNNSVNNNQTYNTVQEPTYIYGCTDSNAINFNSNATKDDGSCIARKNGCMDSTAINYDASANTNDDSCQYQKTITEEESIKYKTTYKDNNELTKDSIKTIQKGENGKKEITYNIIVDSSGNVISKEKVEEKVIEKPIDKIVERGTKESNNYIAVLFYLVAILTITLYKPSHKNNKLLYVKIGKCKKLKKILLYIFYFVFVIPVFIDFIIIIINVIKEKIKN